jgi:hypothetical protein
MTLHHQFGIPDGGEQEPQSEQVEFYGGMVIPAFRRETQTIPRTLQYRI